MVELSKILKDKKDLQKIRSKFQNKKIGLCHGVFDIVHNGHLEHFNKAKKNCDILIVSITSDQYVMKGPHQPYNNEQKRLNFIRNLKTSDFVYLNNHLTSEELINNLKPNLYFKGLDYKKKDITKNLVLEKKSVERNKGKLVILETKMMSSTKILYDNIVKLPNAQLNVLKKISNNFSFNDISNFLDSYSSKEITIIGEPIFDIYTECEITGKTSKDPALSVIKGRTNTYEGGVLPVAKILSKFYKKVNLITYGNQDELKKIFGSDKNIKLINCFAKPIQKKHKYITSGRLHKLIQISNFRKNNFTTKNKNKAISIIQKTKGNDILICDFGLGFFDDRLIQSIKKKKIFLNVQTNSLNFGTNFYHKYKKFNYLSLDMREWEMSLKPKINDIRALIRIISKLNFKASLTLGVGGSYYLNKNSKYFCPVFIDKTIDTIGCGDAYFAITSMILSRQNKKYDLLVSFLGNIYAGMHSQFVGNSKITDKINFKKYIKSLLTIYGQ